MPWRYSVISNQLILRFSLCTHTCWLFFFSLSLQFSSLGLGRFVKRAGVEIQTMLSSSLFCLLQLFLTLFTAFFVSTERVALYYFLQAFFWLRLLLRIVPGSRLDQSASKFLILFIIHRAQCSPSVLNPTIKLLECRLGRFNFWLLRL